MSRFNLAPAQFNNVKTNSITDDFSVVGYGYYSINLEQYSEDVEKEWTKIINLAKTFPDL